MGGSDIVGRGGEIDEESERVAKSGDFVEPSISEWGCGDWVDRETMERSVFRSHVRGVFVEAFTVVQRDGFKKFPGPWKLYIEKENVPGRFELVHESNSRPAGDELDDLVSEVYRGRDVGEDGEMREKSARWRSWLVSPPPWRASRKVYRTNNIIIVRVRCC